MAPALPTVTVVFLAFNRREELRLSLSKTLEEQEYPADQLDLIVVDNASTDGTVDMLEADFPSVRVIRRDWNNGVSGWNEGLRAATGDYILALDDDCYLPPEGLVRSMREAVSRDADLVSYAVISSKDESYRFDLDEYQTGLLSFWGCAVLMRREVIAALQGYDPGIFVSLNELEFMLRFFDRGFRHLHMPEVVAIHAKAPGSFSTGPLPERSYRLIYRNFGYIAAKHLRAGHAAQTLGALLARNLRDGLRIDRVAFKALGNTLKGFAQGLRARNPVRREVSQAYHANFESFVAPWALSRSPLDLIRSRSSGGGQENGDVGRRQQWLKARSRFYPQRADTLEL